MTKLFAGLLVAVTLVSAPAKATDENQRDSKDLMTGSGLVCDTQQQASRFILLMDNDVEKALTAVNAEVGQADACIVATVGFFPGHKVAEVEKDGAIINVIEILVMAVATPKGLHVIEPKIYYSVVEAKQLAI